MKKQIVVAVAISLFLSMMSCKKDVTTIPEETVDTVEVVDTVDTVDTVEENIWEVDTTDEAVFEEVDLEAQFDSLVKANLQTLHFAHNSYELTAESMELLVVAAKFLQTEKKLRIKVEGHTDERGSTDYNLALGEKRAAAVRDYLVRYGIESFRIEITSFGKEKLLEYGCATDDCHFNNRRAEYVVIK